MPVSHSSITRLARPGISKPATSLFVAVWSGLGLCGGCQDPSGSQREPGVEAHPAQPTAQPTPKMQGSPRASAPTLKSTYRVPAPEVVQIVDAAPTPSVVFDHAHTRAAIASYPALPPIRLLARPMLRLAGVRIDPDYGQRRRTRFYDSIRLKNVLDGKQVAVRVPEGSQLSAPSWSPRGTHVAFTITADDGVKLWVADALSGHAKQVLDRPLNATLTEGFVWLPKGDGLLVWARPQERGPSPTRPSQPIGPIVSTTSGRKAANRTYQDLLQDEFDELLFEYHARSRLLVVELDGSSRALGDAGIFTQADVAPNAEHVLVQRIKRPFSRVVPYYRFARSYELWPFVGPGRPKVLAQLPKAEEVPIQGVTTGMRAAHWQPTAQAALIWSEALDGGDPNTKVAHRDRLMRMQAPFEDATEIARAPQRLTRVAWLQTEGQYLVSDYDRDRRWTTTVLRDLNRPDLAHVLFDRSVHDRYRDPGMPLYTRLANGQHAVKVDRGRILLSGKGASPKGDRPFLDQCRLQDGHTTRLFRSPVGAYAQVVGLVQDDPTRWIVRKETPSEPPNYHLWQGDHRTAFTSFPHPHPKLSTISKQLLRYKRKDGVPLSGTLYLPPDHRPGDRHPLVVWAYPREYKDRSVAGQVRAAPTRFTRLARTSPLMFLTQRYAVLHRAAMPVVGEPETMNDTFVLQISAAAEAAIEAVDKLGVIDRDRVAIAGHSYGAFMTANLLAHTDLFRAGIARSGAYNRSLTPFGFQSERRTLWAATDTYVSVSPLFSAEKLNEPILLIHGQIDNNSGTFPLQSKRLFHALSGLEGTARLVLLPHESHGYRARESVLHVLAESFDWLDKHVRHAPARSSARAKRAHPDKHKPAALRKSRR